MLSKTKRARTAKPAARRKLSKKLKPAVVITLEEVVSFEQSAAAQKRSEAVWLNMTAPAHAPEDDHWNGVEEHLLAKGAQEEASQRRWKYFAK
jgi:hypothetical protein